MLGLICFAILFLLKNKARNPADRFRAHFAAVKSGDCSPVTPSHFVLFSYDFHDLCLHLPKNNSRTPHAGKAVLTRLIPSSYEIADLLKLPTDILLFIHLLLYQFAPSFF